MGQRMHIVSGHPSPSEELVHELAWFARDVVRIERYFSRVTVKRRRNLAQPIRRRRSAFRDPLICLDFLAMAWLGATRLSQIASHLRGRADLAEVFGLPRFCDHTTAHNFLTGCHRTHVRQLAAANRRLLCDHGAALHAQAPILDLDMARRSVRRTGGRRDLVYQWAVAWCAGEGVEQSLEPCDADAADLLVRTVDRARAALDVEPRLVRLTAPCVSVERLRALERAGLPFVARTTWPWALAHRPEGHRRPEWRRIGLSLRALDLGVAAAARRLELRTILVERPAPTPGQRRQRIAIVTSLVDEDAAALVRLSSTMTAMRAFFGHPRWPLGDGKMPSADPRGNAAYLWLGTIATNVLRLFARHLGHGESLASVRAGLRVIPRHGRDVETGGAALV